MIVIPIVISKCNNHTSPENPFSKETMLSKTTLESSCDTKLLVAGFIRSNCKNIVFDQCNVKDSSIQPILHQICLSYYYYLNFFCPEKFIKFDCNRNKIRKISGSTGKLTENKTLGQELCTQLKECRSGDTIHLYPGEYFFNDIKLKRAKSIHIIGICDIGEVILKGRIIVTAACNIHFENVVFCTADLELTMGEDDMLPKLVDIGEFMCYYRPKINMFFSSCLFRYHENWCINTDEECGLYLMNCRFNGCGDGEAGSAIAINPCYTEAHVIGCIFDNCAQSSRPYLDVENETFYSDVRPCIEIRTSHISLSKKMNRKGKVKGTVIIVGNEFRRNGGPLIQMEMAVNYDIKLFLAENTTDDKDKRANDVKFLNNYEYELQWGF